MPIIASIGASTMTSYQLQDADTFHFSDLLYEATANIDPMDEITIASATLASLGNIALESQVQPR